MIYRLRDTPAGLDRYGDPVVAATTQTVIDGAYVAPVSSADIADRARDGQSATLTLFAPYGTDLVATDRVRVDDGNANDGEYRIEGVPADWRFELGSKAPAGQATRLVRAVG